MGAFSLTPLNHLIIKINYGILQVSLPKNSSIQVETKIYSLLKCIILVH